jgi:hypothetical protein
MSAFYMKDNEGLIIDDCMANSKKEAFDIFIGRGHPTPFSIEE